MMMMMIIIIIQLIFAYESEFLETKSSSSSCRLIKQQVGAAHHAPVWFSWKLIGSRDGVLVSGGCDRQLLAPIYNLNSGRIAAATAQSDDLPSFQWRLRVALRRANIDSLLAKHNYNGQLVSWLA